MGLTFDDRQKCEWYCGKCKMGTWTQHKHEGYVGVKSKVVRPKPKKQQKGLHKQKKLGKKLWREYYKSVEFIKHL